MPRSPMVITRKLFFATLLALAVPAFSEGEAVETTASQSETDASELAQKLYIASALFYSSRDDALRAEAQSALTRITEDLLVTIEGLQDQASRDSINSFLEISQLALEGHEISDYDCEDLVAARSLALEGLSQADDFEEYCGGSDARCMKFVRFIWAQIMATYMLKASDPSGLGGHSYFISGETDRDLIGLHTRLDTAIESMDHSGLSSDQSGAIAKIEFLRPTVINPQQSVPYVALRYLVSINGLK